MKSLGLPSGLWCGAEGYFRSKSVERKRTVKDHEFVANVRELAEVSSNEEAEKAIRATLETLRERLAGQEPQNLASQLPGDLGEPLNGTGGQDNFSLGEFYERVSQKEGVGADEAGRHARAVAAVIQTAVTAGELEDVRSQLKDDYDELFGVPGE